MKTLILVPDAFGAYGGIANFNRNFLRALCAHPACREVVAVPRHMPNPVQSLPDNLTYVTSGLQGKLRYVAAVLNVVRHNREFDMIVSGHINLLPIAFLLRFWVRAPIVLITHGIEAWEPTGRILSDGLVNRVDASISVSEVTKQRMLGWTRLSSNQAYLLPNAIDLERFYPGTKNTMLINKHGLAGKRVLMTLGRLASRERYKGFDEVLELLPEIKEEVPNVVYLVGGDGPDRPRLETKARSLGVDDCVVFTGLVPEAEKVDYYRIADAYVMPSRGEGFGIVLLEAMACGIPVVASKVDGSREAVREGTMGILVDPGDSQDVKAGILKALSQPKGVVPEGLDYYSYDSFELRLHNVSDAIMQVRLRNEE